MLGGPGIVVARVVGSGVVPAKGGAHIVVLGLRCFEKRYQQHQNADDISSSLHRHLGLGMYRRGLGFDLSPGIMFNPSLVAE